LTTSNFPLYVLKKLSAEEDLEQNIYSNYEKEILSVAKCMKPNPKKDVRFLCKKNKIV